MRLDRLTANTIVDRTQLLDEIDRIGKRGWAIDNIENEPRRRLRRRPRPRPHRPVHRRHQHRRPSRPSHLALAEREPGVDHVTITTGFLHAAHAGFVDVLDRYRGLRADRKIALSLLNLGDTHLALAEGRRDLDIDHLPLVERVLHEARAEFPARDNPDP